MIASANVPIVHRSAELMPLLYGANFRFEEYLCVSNYAWGVRHSPRLSICLYNADA